MKTRAQPRGLRASSPTPRPSAAAQTAHAFPYECITVEAMDAVVEMLVHLVGLYAHFEEKGEKA